MSIPMTITAMNNGGIVEAIDEALALVAANIDDCNTPPDKVREVNVKIKIKPDINRTLGTATATVTTKLQPQEAQVVSVVFDRAGDKPTIYESFASQRPDQHLLEGTSREELHAQNVTPFRASAQ